MNTAPPKRIPVTFLSPAFLVNADEARALLGNMSLRTFRRLVGRDQIQKVCRNRYSVRQIEAWVRSQEGL
jgi:hypothetical protein